MKIDIQVNGGSGLLFNNIKNINEFLKIELNQLKYGECFIVPTFITDSDENLKRFVEIVKQRIDLNEKKYEINGKTIVLPKLFGVHFEGPFITNKGTHPQKYLKEFNEKNLNDFIKIINPLKDFNIFFTFAPELLKDVNLLEKLKSDFKNITISAGHTNITKDKFEKLQEKLGDNKIKMLTHFHNAMFGGHFVNDIGGIPDYVMENEYDGYFDMIIDGQHTAKGELLPTLLNYYDEICIVSDGAAPACCKVDENNNLFEMGGNICTVEQKNGELPSFFWTDFSKNKDFYEKDLNKIYNMYIKGEGGYKTLAGSAINLQQSYEFLKNLHIKSELEKSKLNSKAKRFLEIGLKKNNLQESDIKSFLEKHLDRMFFDNPVNALNIDKDIYNYEFKDNKLYKNNNIFIDFDNDFGDFLEQVNSDQTKLKNKLMDFLSLLVD
ncbi:MAG TPA: hypothetical protein VLL98_02715 [Rickettsiales bacterium]|nr:hypothetical protein [Rickettsiales bacterium]